VQNANKLIAASGVNNNVIYQGLTAGTYTASIFAKKGEFEGLVMATGTTGAFFNLNTNTYRTNYSNPPTSYKIEDYGNGWHRYSITFTEAGANSLYIGPNDNVSNSLGVTGNNSDGIYIYGAQLEASVSYATSYIPTYGTSVTRNADIFKVNNIGTNNLITNDAFTLFIDIASVQDSENSFRDLVAIFGSKNFRLETRTSGQVRSQQIGMVTSGDNFNSVTIGTYNIRKFAFTFTTTQCKMYVDGALHSTYNGVYTHDFNVLSVRNSSSLGAELKNEYRKVMLFPTALSEQEAIDLTTI
jgi:hypothetical protein